jgi:hypothetical protein
MSCTALAGSFGGRFAVSASVTNFVRTFLALLHFIPFWPDFVTRFLTPEN